MKRPSYTTIGVRFSGLSKVYTYRVPRGHGIKRGDMCAVDSPSQGPTLVFVVRVDTSAHLPPGFTLQTLKDVSGVVRSLP